MRTRICRDQLNTVRTDQEIIAIKITRKIKYCTSTCGCEKLEHTCKLKTYYMYIAVGLDLAFI